jgi:hypothetical protein
MKIIAGMIALMIIASGSSAARADDCDAALIKDNYASASSTAEKLALLSIYDRETSQSMANSGGGGVNIFGIGISGDFDKEHSQIDKLFQSLDFHYSRSDALAYSISRLSPAAADAYVRCLEVHEKGVHAWFTEVTDDRATLHIRWSDLPNAPADARLDGPVQFRGTTTSPAIIRSPLPHGSEQSFILDRIPGEELRVVINAGGTTAIAFVPNPPQFVEPTIPSVAEKIASGRKFRVIFDVGHCNDSLCAVDWRQTPMGNIKFGETYTVWVHPDDYSWTATGPNQSQPNCGLLTATYPQAGASSYPDYVAKGELNIWGATFGFNKDGEVIAKTTDACEKAGSVVGHIVFSQ